MNLATVFDAMHDFVVGELSHEQAVSRLYAGQCDSRDAARLRIYRRAYLCNVTECSDILFPVTRRHVVRLLGEDGWTEMQRRLGTAHPMPEIRFGTAALVDELSGPAAASLGLPPWLGELADLELWERRIWMAPDVPPRPCLSLAEPHVVREYVHDVLALRLDPALLDAEVRPTVVACWRTSSRERRTRRIGAAELAVLSFIYGEARFDAAEVAESYEMSSHQVIQAHERLRRLGFVEVPPV